MKAGKWEEDNMKDQNLGISISAPTETVAPEDNQVTMEPLPVDPENIFEPVVEYKEPSYKPNEFREQAKQTISTNQTVTDDSLRRDPYFIAAAKIISKKDYPAEWETMSDEEHTTSFLTKLNRNTYNITRAVATAVEYDDADAESLAALSYGMEMYEAKDISWAGSAGAMWALGSDPFTLGSIMSLGAGTAGREVAKQGTVAMLRQSLAKRMRSLAVADAALFGTVAETSYQGLEKTVGIKDEFDYGNIAAVGAVSGVAGGVIHKVASKFKKE